MNFKALFALATTASLAGCMGGPAALPALYGQRDAISRVIDDIEDRYQVAPRPSIDRPEDQETKTAVARLQEENYRLREEIEESNREWFKTLSPDQQLQWKMHRDLLTALGRTGARPPIPGIQPERPAASTPHTEQKSGQETQPPVSTAPGSASIGPPAIESPGN